jgi:hypothetical protein
LLESICIKYHNGRFAGLAKGLERPAVKINLDSAGIGQFQGDAAVGLPFDDIADDKVITL